MAGTAYNISKGDIGRYYNNVKSNSPATSALVLVPLETAGLEADATLADYDTLAALLAGTTNEQTTMGRKTFTDAELAALPTPDDANNWKEYALPAFTYVAPAGNAISRMLVCYDPDTTAGTDADLIPLGHFDCVYTPNAIDLVFNAGPFYRTV